VQWSPEEDVPNRSGHQRKKELGDRAKGHTMDAGTVHPEKKWKKKNSGPKP